MIGTKPFLQKNIILYGTLEAEFQLNCKQSTTVKVQDKNVVFKV